MNEPQQVIYGPLGFPGASALRPPPSAMRSPSNLMPIRGIAQGERKAPRKALNMDPMTGEVYQDTERRAGDTGPALGGVTFFDVANFGKYSGHGTSQGGIGRAGNNAPAPTGMMPVEPPMAQFPVAPAPPPAMLRSPAPQPRPSPAPVNRPLMKTFPGSGVLSPLSADRGPLRKAEMERTAGLYNGVEFPRFADGGMTPAGPFIAGDLPEQDLPPGAMTAGPRVVTSGMPNTMSDRYGFGSVEGILPRPELLVTQDAVVPVGMQGPEVIQTQQPAVVIPNPATIQERLRQNPAYQPIGSNYQPNQPGLQWTGSGFAHAPGGVRKTDIRRFMRSPQGVGMVMGQQADAQRFQQGLVADDLREQRMDQRWQQREKQQLDTQMTLRKADDAMADIISREKINALSGTSSILTPGDAETLSKITAPKAREAALETIVRLRIDERERKAREEERAKELESNRRFTDVPGTDYIMNERGQTLPKARPEKPAIEPPEGFEITGYSVNGTPMLRKVKTEPAMRTVLDAMGDVKEFPAGKKLPSGWKELEDETPAASASVPAPARAKIKSITPVP